MFRTARRIPSLMLDFERKFLGLNEDESHEVGTSGRLGLFVSGAFLVSVGLLIVLLSDVLIVVTFPLFLFGAFNLVYSIRKTSSLGHSNLLTLSGHLVAAVAFYLLISRMVWVPYRTDSIVATYMGILKVLALQNPYTYSMKPFMDQFGFPPSIYTPHLDGSFEFHLNYGALNFLSLLPLYVAGLHDLRDGVFIFHVASILLIFALVPARQKALSLAPFVLFPSFIAGSWTDSIWAFFLVLCLAFWYRNRNMGLAMLGLAGATKQIALLAAPLLLVRVWQESPTSKLKNTLVGTAIAVAGFLGPSLPFILSSPSQWWASTIVPYFPGAAAMISGGVGLSEILLDLGLAPSPFFFAILMVLATVGSFYLYRTRFSRSACFVWFFPVLVLFFYHRSFPNYLFYWTFPVAFEFFRHRPSLLGHSAPFRSIPQRIRKWSSLHSLSWKSGISLLACLLVAATFVGAYGAYVSRPPLSKIDVQINSVSDPDQVGVGTTLSITLNNLTPSRINPLFFVKWDWLPYLWASNSTGNLDPLSRESYLVTASDGLSALPRSSNFRLYVFDADTGELVGESFSATANTVLPPLANPCFKWWTLDMRSGTRVPLGWKLTATNVDSIASVIRSLNNPSNTGINLELNYTSVKTGIEKVMISQTMSLNSTQLQLSLLDGISADTKAELGLTVSDGVHQLAYIFSNSTTKPVLSISGQKTTILVPIPRSVWASVPLDPNHDWFVQGWTVPNRITLTIYLQADNPGVYSASIRELRVTV